MIQALAVALLSGLVSALLFGGLSPGSLLTLLAFVAPLPLMLAGLAWHPLVAALAALVGCIAISLVVQPITGAIYGAMIGLPAYAMVALARRRLGEGVPDGRLAGQGLMALVIYAALMAIVPSLLMFPDFETLRGEFRTLATALMGQLRGSAPEGAQNDAALANLAEMISRLILPMLAGTVVITHALSTAAAFALAGRTGRLPFPRPDLGLTRLPPGALIVLAASIVLSSGEGYLGAFAGAVLVGMMLALMLLGLAVVHVRTRGRPLRTALIVLAWGSVLLIGLPGAFFAGVGLIDHLFNLRRQPAPPPDAASR